MYGTYTQQDITGAYGVYGLYGEPVVVPKPEPVQKLTVKERVATIVGKAPSFDAAVRNVKELIQNDQDIAKILPLVIESLGEKYTPKLLETQGLKQLKLTPTQVQEFYKIKAALALELPQARQWLRNYSEQYPELLGEYFALVLRINAVSEALELLRTGLNFTQLPRLTIQQPAATQEQILGLKYLTVTPV